MSNSGEREGREREEGGGVGGGGVDHTYLPRTSNPLYEGRCIVRENVAASMVGRQLIPEMHCVLLAWSQVTHLYEGLPLVSIQNPFSHLLGKM